MYRLGERFGIGRMLFVRGDQSSLGSQAHRGVCSMVLGGSEAGRVPDPLSLCPLPSQQLSPVPAVLSLLQGSAEQRSWSSSALPATKCLSPVLASETVFQLGKSQVAFCF